ncbi:MAG: putative DNA binding domain-containing protein [Proteobacteria bacterium]|nr:putative DNA binding domain-containing protein [Pseudomonadota bacterium]
MTISLAELQKLMAALEDENLEFKEAKQSYPFDKLLKYCAALANEGGGKIILGITDRRPRRIVGTHAFSQQERTRAGLMEKLRIKVDADEIHSSEGRALVFTVPPRPVGVPIQADGIYWTRRADSLVPMTEDQLRDIFDEIGHDFSADVCPGATLDDLDPVAVEDFRKRWIEKSGNSALARLEWKQVLQDAEAVAGENITYAALILFGTYNALGRHLAQAEVVFEYRSSEESGPAQQRKEYRQAFFSFYDELWKTINLRNDLQHYQDGLFMRDIPTFEERSVREAILNAVSHRDYRHGGNVFVRQYPRYLKIESPGGLPHGITLENILDRQYPRNRRIADIFARCGLVERAGQGMNLIFEEAIRRGKLPPDFTGTDRYQVDLVLPGQVQDPAFVLFLEKIGSEREVSFSTQDLLILDRVHRGLSVEDPLKPRLPYLVETGALECVGRGRGARYVLARRFYAITGRKGVYTRKVGLDKETNKALLLKHIRASKAEGARMQELQQVLPGHSRQQIQRLLSEIATEGHIQIVGIKRAARWHSIGND